MDRKINFWDFTTTLASWVGVGLGIGVYFLVGDTLKDMYPNFNHIISVAFAILFYVVYALSAISAHNKKIDKNIKDRKENE